MIKYIKGDATQPVDEGHKVIVHVCNDIGAWGAGFVLALQRRWPVTKQQYLNWKRKHHGDFLPLGEVQFIRVTSDIWVANMIGQHMVGYDEEGESPIRYEAVAKGLEVVQAFAQDNDCSVHMPRIGCGLAGGTWEKMGPVVEAALKDVSVTVYDFNPGA